MNEDNKQNNKQNSKLAKVTGFFENNCPKITFYGEDNESEKKYSYLKSYKPSLNDTVVLIACNDTWIIAGKVAYDVTPDTEEEYLTEEDVANYLSANDFVTYSTIKTYISNKNYVTSSSLDTKLNSYITNNGLPLYLSNNNYMQKNSGGSISVSSNSYSSINNLDSTNLKCTKFAMQGKTPTSYKNVSSLASNASLETTISKINTIISYLKEFGFFS